MPVGMDFDVVDLPPTDHVAEGETAPDFERPLANDEYWADRRLSELTARGPLLLVFTTMDGAFPAIYVWRELRERDFEVRTVGVSISTPYEHLWLLETYGFDVELFSDPQNGVAEAYGVVHDLDGMAGVESARPAAFLLDGDRTVEYAWVAETWPDFPDYDAVEGAVDGL